MMTFYLWHWRLCLVLLDCSEAISSNNFRSCSFFVLISSSEGLSLPKWSIWWHFTYGIEDCVWCYWIVQQQFLQITSDPVRVLSWSHLERGFPCQSGQYDDILLMALKRRLCLVLLDYSAAISSNNFRSCSCFVLISSRQGFSLPKRSIWWHSIYGIEEKTVFGVTGLFSSNFFK